jgi:hypothetical protein
LWPVAEHATKKPNLTSNEKHRQQKLIDEWEKQPPQMVIRFLEFVQSAGKIRPRSGKYYAVDVSVKGMKAVATAVVKSLAAVTHIWQA